MSIDKGKTDILWFTKNQKYLVKIMSRVLITNLGNRNITWKGKTYNEIIKTENQPFKISSFLEWTESLEQQYSLIENDLDINIFNPLIESNPRPDKIILIYSDQSQLNTRTDQDTIIEARLIKIILQNKYNFKEEQIKLEAVKAKVIDTGALMNSYRKKLNFIKKEGFSKVIICDAGGTAQQKMALKIMAEFMFEGEQYEIKYTEDNAIVSDVSILEYRSVINKEQAIKLIKSGEFLAAIEILGYNLNDVPSDIAGRMAIHLFWKYTGNVKKAQNAIKSNSVLANNTLLEPYLNNQSTSKNIELQVFFGNDLLQLTEKLIKVHYLIQKKKYSEAVLVFSQFYEYYFDLIIVNLSPEYNFGRPYSKNNTEEQAIELNTFIAIHYPNLQNHKPRIDQINTKLLVVKALFTSQTIGEIAFILSPHINFTDDFIDNQSINAVRNKIAHEGLFIDDNTWNKSYIYINNCINDIIAVFKIPDLNIYEELSKITEEYLRS